MLHAKCYSFWNPLTGCLEILRWGGSIEWNAPNGGKWNFIAGVHTIDRTAAETFVVAFTVGMRLGRCRVELQWTVIMDTCSAVVNWPPNCEMDFLCWLFLLWDDYLRTMLKYWDRLSFMRPLARVNSYLRIKHNAIIRSGGFRLMQYQQVEEPCKHTESNFPAE